MSTDDERTPYLDLLPIEDLYSILVLLDPQSLSNFCSTETRIRNICRSQEFLKAKLKHDNLSLNYSLWLNNLEEYKLLYETRNLNPRKPDYELIKRTMNDFAQLGNFNLLVEFIKDLSKKINALIVNKVEKLTEEKRDKEKESYEEYERYYKFLLIELKQVYRYVFDYVINVLMEAVLILHEYLKDIKSFKILSKQIQNDTKINFDVFFNEGILHEFLYDFLDRKDLEEPYYTLVVLLSEFDLHQIILIKDCVMQLRN